MADIKITGPGPQPVVNAQQAALEQAEMARRRRSRSRSRSRKR